jgi:hypothetical protein
MRLIIVMAAVLSGFVFISLVFFQATPKTYPGFGHINQILSDPGFP